MSCNKLVNAAQKAAEKNGVPKPASQTAYYTGQQAQDWETFKNRYLAALAQKPPQVEVAEAAPGTRGVYGVGKRRTRVVAVDRRDPNSWPAWVRGHPLNLTPLYSNLFIPPEEPRSGLLWTGTKNSLNGRLRRHGEYLPRIQEREQQQKWGEVAALSRKFSKIEADIRQAAARGDEAAACMLLISSLGIRADVKQGGRAEKNVLPDGGTVGGDRRFGATSIQARHVKFVPNNPHLLRIEFPGKGTMVSAKLNTRLLSDDPKYDRAPYLTRVRQLLRKKAKGEELTLSEKKEVDQAYQFLQTHQVVFDPQLFALLKERRVKASTASQPIFSTSYSQVKRFVDRLCQKHKLQISPHNFRHRLANQRFEELCDAAAVRWDITQPQELNEELRGTRLERRRLKAAGRQAGILGAAADFIDDSMDRPLNPILTTPPPPWNDYLGMYKTSIEMECDGNGVPTG